MIIAGQEVNTSSATQQAVLGTYAETPDGRGFRYALNGATSTVVGKVYTSSTWDGTNQQPVGGLAVNAAVAIGGTQVVTSTSTTLAANLVAGGYLAFDAGTPAGTLGGVFKVKSNTATVSAVGATFNLEDPLTVALTTSSKFVIIPHPYSNIIVSPGGASVAMPVGVATSIITNAQYGWIQTFGTCAVLSGVATSISLPGVPVTPGATTAGSVILSTAILPTIGWAQQLFTATEYNYIYLLIH